MKTRKSWEEPIARLCKIVKYRIEMQDAAEEEAETVKKTIEGQTTCRFEELRRGQACKVRVQAEATPIKDPAASKKGARRGSFSEVLQEMI